jgi:uncharacterized protein
MLAWPPKNKPPAAVTGDSIGIGYELAKLCAGAGFGLLAAANELEIKKAQPTSRL